MTSYKVTHCLVKSYEGPTLSLELAWRSNIVTRTHMKVQHCFVNSYEGPTLFCELIRRASIILSTHAGPTLSHELIWRSNIVTWTRMKVQHCHLSSHEGPTLFRELMQVQHCLVNVYRSNIVLWTHTGPTLSCELIWRSNKVVKLNDNSGCMKMT